MDYLKYFLTILTVAIFHQIKLYSQEPKISPYENYEGHYWTQETYEPPFFRYAKSLWLQDTIINKFSIEEVRKKERERIEEKQIHMDNKKLDSIINIYDDLPKFQKWKYLDTLGMVKSTMQIALLERLLLSDLSSGTKIKCAESLGNLNSRSSIVVLIEATKLKNRKIKKAAALALVKLKESEYSCKALEEIWNCGSGSDQFDCIQGFRDLESDESIKKLKRISKESNASFENEAYYKACSSLALAQLGESKLSYSILSDLIKHKNKYIRVISLVGLAYINTNQSVELILELKDDSEKIVSDKAKLVLNIIKINE